MNLGECYDTPALKAIREEPDRVHGGLSECYRRAYRCLAAAAQIEADRRALLLTSEVEARMVKRARGILSRECKRTGKEPAKPNTASLDAISCKGVQCNFETAEGAVPPNL